MMALVRAPDFATHRKVAVVVPRTAWRNCSVIAGSKLSVTSTVSFFTAITTGPSSVCQV